MFEKTPNYPQSYKDEVISVLDKIFRYDFKYNNNDIISQIYNGQLLNNNFIKAKAYNVIVSQHDTIKDFHFLLSGSCIVTNEFYDDDDFIIDRLTPLSIIGTSEILIDISIYSSYVIADADCVFFKINADLFLDIIRNDANLCYRTLLLQAKELCEARYSRQIQMFFKPIDTVGYYIYTNAKDNLPYICELSRQELAETLNINLRSLYRYLGELEKLECIKLKNGRIKVDIDNYYKLKYQYGDIVL